MPWEPGIERAPEGAAPRVRRLASPRRWERAVLGMLHAGLTVEQMSRLADLRVRRQREAPAGGAETWTKGPRAIRRLEFARWLVQTGRLRDR